MKNLLGKEGEDLGNMPQEPRGRDPVKKGNVLVVSDLGSTEQDPQYCTEEGQLVSLVEEGSWGRSKAEGASKRMLS